MPEDIHLHIDKKEPTQQEKADVIKGILGFGEIGVEALSQILSKLVDLAKTNGLWGAVLGFLIVEISSTKIDVVKWRHVESVSYETTRLTVAQSIANANAAALNQPLPYPQVTMAVPQWQDGLISSNAATIIKAMIVSSVGIAEVSSLINTVANILPEKLTSTASQSIAVPSLTTWVEGGKQPTIDISKK